MGERAEAVGGAEGAGEVTLVVEATVEGDLADRRGGFLELAAGHEETDAEDVVARVHAEEATELALEVARGKIGARGEIGDRDGLRVVGEDVFAGPGEATVVAGGGAGVVVEAHHSGDAEDGTARTEERKFAGYIPTGHAVGALHQPDLVDEGRTGVHDAAIFLDVLRGERGRVEVEVGAAEHLGFGAAAMKREERAVHLHVAVAAVFEEEEDVGEDVEELGEDLGVGEALEEVGGDGGGRRRRGGAGGGHDV